MAIPLIMSRLALLKRSKVQAISRSFGYEF